MTSRILFGVIVVVAVSFISSPAEARFRFKKAFRVKFSLPPMKIPPIKVDPPVIKIDPPAVKVSLPPIDVAKAGHDVVKVAGDGAGKIIHETVKQAGNALGQGIEVVACPSGRKGVDGQCCPVVNDKSAVTPPEGCQ